MRTRSPVPPVRPWSPCDGLEARLVPQHRVRRHGRYRPPPAPQAARPVVPPRDHPAGDDAEREHREREQTDHTDERELGFCRECGSRLFWRRVGGARTSIAAGTLDEPTGLRTVAHIYVGSKGDYYEIADGLPQYEASARSA